MTKANGYVAFVLHAHLPFVRHPELDASAEENWLFQALTESYIPLLRALDGLVADGISPQLTLSLSPTLVAMLSDPHLRGRYRRHLDRIDALVSSEQQRDASEARGLSEFYRGRLQDVRTAWRDWGGDLIWRFRHLADEGHLELFTCAATHGYLPLLRTAPTAIAAQIQVAVDQHERIFRRRPRGIWLPECGYYPGLDRVLKRAGLRYFVVDDHALHHATPVARAGCHAPVLCAETGLAAFARDRAAANDVWHPEHGYPAHPDYREYHCDIGFSRPIADLTPLIQSDDARMQTGFKYLRVTGHSQAKEPYDPNDAAHQARFDAEQFIDARLAQVASISARSGAALAGRPPLIVAPFDAELFGHWWYEGPIWLEQTLRQMATSPQLEPIQLGRYLTRYPTQQVVTPAESSWGEQGYHGFWLHRSNDWIYAHLHQAALKMTQLVRTHHGSTSASERDALSQAARELLLAQASDWAFILRSGTTTAYAEERTVTHLRRFQRLARDLEQGSLDTGWLTRVRRLDNLFAELDVSCYGDEDRPISQVLEPDLVRPGTYMRSDLQDHRRQYRPAPSR